MTRTRRRLLLALGVLLVVLAVPAAFVGRAVFFPPTYAVVSIATAHEYKDAALLERAWALPVARTYAEHVDFQPNGSLCGPTSVANVLRSLSLAPTDPRGIVEGTGKCPFGICLGGLSLDDLDAIAEKKSGRKVTVLRDLSLDEFRTHMEHSNDPARRYVVNFQRGLLFGKGVGHHSPIAGYLAPEDLVFVLDVNPKFGPWLVKTERLFRAVDSTDSSSGKKRGLLLIE